MLKKYTATILQYMFIVILIINYLTVIVYFSAPNFNYLIYTVFNKYIYVQNIIVPIASFTMLLGILLSSKLLLTTTQISNKNIDTIQSKSTFLYYIYKFSPKLQLIFLVLIIVNISIVIYIMMPKGANYYWYNNNIYFYKETLLLFVVAFFHIVYYRTFPNKVNRDILYVLLGVLVSLLLFYIFIILYKFNYIFGDSILLITGNNIFSSFLGPNFGSGRYFPFSQLHYLLLYHYKYYISPYLFAIENILILLLSVLFIFLALLKEKVYHRNLVIFILISILLIPSLSQVLLDNIFSETGMLFLISLFILGYSWAEQKESYFRYTIAFIPCYIVAYYKETAFILSFVVGAGGLLFGWRYISKFKRYFYILLILNVIVFLLMYYFTTYIYISHDSSYLKTHTFDSSIIKQLSIINKLYNINISSALPDNYISSFLIVFNIIYILALILLLFRIYRIIFLKDKSLLKADMLLAAGIIWLFSYTVLMLTSIYYLLPASFIIIFSLGLYICYYYKNFNFNYGLNEKITKYKVLLFLLALIVFYPFIIIQNFKSSVDTAIFYTNMHKNNIKVIDCLLSLKKQNMSLVYKGINILPFSEINLYMDNILNGYLNLSGSKNFMGVKKEMVTFLKSKKFNFTNDNQLLVIGYYSGIYKGNLAKNGKLLLQLSGVYSNKTIYYLGSDVYFNVYSLKPLSQFTKIFNTSPTPIHLNSYDKRLDMLK